MILVTSFTMRSSNARHATSTKVWPLISSSLVVRSSPRTGRHMSRRSLRADGLRARESGATSPSGRTCHNPWYPDLEGAKHRRAKHALEIFLELEITSAD